MTEPAPRTPVLTAKTCCCPEVASAKECLRIRTSFTVDDLFRQQEIDQFNDLDFQCECLCHDEDRDMGDDEWP
jgi:hypothetical protein